MLDFYWIRDEQPMPEYPEQAGLRYAGGIPMEVWERLQRKGILDQELSYFSDFRWSRQDIRRMRQRMEDRSMSSDTDIRLLDHLLNPAFAADYGLMAVGD